MEVMFVLILSALCSWIVVTFGLAVISIADLSPDLKIRRSENEDRHHSVHGTEHDRSRCLRPTSTIIHGRDCDRPDVF